MSKRLKSKKYPPGIDANKLPANVNFHASRKIWYLSFFEDGIRKTKKIATADATMSDLWEAVKQPAENTSSFQWLVDQFEQSPQFRKLAKNTCLSHQNTWAIILKQATASGAMLSETNRHKWTQPLVQKFIDKIAEDRPTTAVRAKQNLSRLFNWGINRGYMKINPASNIEIPELKPKRVMPSKAVLARVISYAKQSEKVNPIIWKSLEIARLCRLRGIEVRQLTDADILEDGLLCRRSKGSATNVTLWDDKLKAVIDACIKDRDALWAKRRYPYPMNPKDRRLLVNRSGDSITSDGWHSVWRRFMENCVRDGIILEEEKFGLHGMKRRGVTDTKAGEDKAQAAGLKSQQMVRVYDKSIPRVNTPD